MHPLLRRTLVIGCILWVGAGLIARAARSEATPLRKSLDTIPMVLGAWRGVEAPKFDPKIISVLGVDEHVNRTYATSARHPVSLYIGYYRSQRQGDTMHSPLNCMPGSGWEPMSKTRVDVDVIERGAPRTIRINQLLIQKGADKQVALYWYQGRGRVVASEYTGKIFTVVDAIRMNRTDGAMVRIIAPVLGDEKAAQQQALEFTRAIFPRLAETLPL